MNLKYKKAKSVCLIIILFLCSFIIFNLYASNLLAQNQDCPTCPNIANKNNGEKGAEIKSNYSKKELEKMFPVPEQWKEWYKLEKEGKLPKYIIIKDVSGRGITSEYIEGSFKPKIIYIDYIQNDLNINRLFKFKEHLNTNKLLTITDYKKEIESIKGYKVWLDIHYYKKDSYLSKYSTYVDILQNYYKYISNIDHRSYCIGFVSEYFRSILLKTEKHPLFFKEELNYIYAFESQMWSIYFYYKKDNKNQISKILSNRLLDILYQSGSNFNYIEKELQDPSIYTFFTYFKTFYDPVNAKEIVYYDNRFLSFYERIYKKAVEKNNIEDQRIILKYFCDIGETKKYLKQVIELCRKMFGYHSWDTFYSFLEPYKNTQEVKGLAEYYFNNIKKMDKSDREFFRVFLKNEFGYSSKDDFNE